MWENNAILHQKIILLNEILETIINETFKYKKNYKIYILSTKK